MINIGVSPQPFSGRKGPRAAVTILVSALLAALSAACQPEPDIPSYWQAPPLNLIDQNGQSFGQDQLGGRVALVDFIYTNCADVCPMLTATFRFIQERLTAEKLLPAKALLISVTVDPERDSPSALRQYGASVGAHPEGWKFLTGDRAVLEETLVQGFKLPFRAPTAAGTLQPGFEITHTNRVIVIDRAGMIRGLLSADDLDVEQTVRTLKRLVS